MYVIELIARLQWQNQIARLSKIARFAMYTSFWKYLKSERGSFPLSGERPRDHLIRVLPENYVTKRFLIPHHKKPIGGS
jgi:hypothetical protein